LIYPSYIFRSYRYVTHCLLHVTQNVEQLQANLDEIAAWPFESLARIFKPFLRTGFKPVNQVNNRLMERYVHHVPTFMDIVHPYGNRMKYVMGDIGANRTGTSGNADHRKQHKISPADLEKTAIEYSRHMSIQSLAQAKRSATVTKTAGKTPLRMFMGHGGQRGQSATQNPAPICKRLTYESFELGNNYPNNCALVVDTRHWREKQEIRFHVVIIHDIFATKMDDHDKLDLQSLKEIEEKLLKSTSTSTSTTADNRSPTLDISNMQAVITPASSNSLHHQDSERQKIIFRISASKFQECDPFSNYPIDSSKDHVYEVRKPRDARTLFIANQVCAKMIALPLVLGKPHNIAASTLTDGLLLQKWHVAPLLHGLYLSHTKIQSSFASMED
jgi:hypothetical protein